MFCADNTYKLDEQDSRDPLKEYNDSRHDEWLFLNNSLKQSNLEKISFLICDFFVIILVMNVIIMTEQQFDCNPNQNNATDNDKSNNNYNENDNDKQ